MLCSEIRGFNYDGSWGTSGLDLWQHHDNGLMAVEVARGKRYFPGWNVARWWLSDEAFQRSPVRFLANFEAGLQIFARHDILVMPLLFNRWRDPLCDFGGISLEHIVLGLSSMSGGADLFSGVERLAGEAPLIERLHHNYLEAVVGEHKDDQRIFAWDLCNEPLMGPYAEDPQSPLRAGELRWLTWIYSTAKRIGARQLLTIGSYPNLLVQELLQPLSDIISIHPYYIWNAPDENRQDVLVGTRPAFEAFLDACVAQAQRAGKEMVASETVWGAMDDAKRVDVLRYTLGELKRHNIGFLVHALQHSLVADLHYPAYGPVGWSGVMPFVNPDGALRPGHAAFNEFC